MDVLQNIYNLRGSSIDLGALAISCGVGRAAIRRALRENRLHWYDQDFDEVSIDAAFKTYVEKRARAMGKSLL